MSQNKTEGKRPHASAFKQQQLPAWTPILTPSVVIISFLLVGIVFIPLGVVFLVASNKIVEVSQRYDDMSGCKIGSVCNVTLEVPKTMSSPVFMYYQLDNFYQNHRRYVKSRSDKQLRGESIKDKDANDCDPLKYVDKDTKELMNPCGLIANSKFNDTFSLFSAGNSISLRKEGIAWTSDVKKKFAPGTDEDLIVWMRTAGLPNFKKLYRIIDSDLSAGTYTVLVNNSFDVSAFKGKKHIVLSTTNWLGGKNSFLGIAYIVVGSVCIFLAIVFTIKNMISPRKLGDTQWLFKNQQKGH